jgi:hypothetical protein
MARMNEAQRCCTKVGRWTAHQRIASFPRTLFRDREATCTIMRLIGNYLTTDQVFAVGGIQFQSEPLRKRNHLVELQMLHHATVTMSK